MDLSKLSDADLQALASGDMSKLSDEGLSHLGGQSQPHGGADDHRPLMDKVTDPEIYKKIAFGDPNSNVVEGSPPLAIPAGAIPKLGKLAEFINSSAPRRIATGAAQGAATDPEHPIQGGLRGGLVAAGGEGLSKLLGLGGDVAMQASVGRKKFTPGVGDTLAEEGLIGTKNMLKKQVASRLGARGEEISQLAKQVPAGAIDAQQIGQEIGGEASKPLQIPGGAPAAADVPKLDAISSFANDVSSRGAESGEQALARRIAAGQRSYRGKEDPLQSLLGSLSKSEQMKYSQALKAAHETATGTSALSDADNAYGALKRAQAGLDAPANIPSSLLGLVATSTKVLPGSSLALSTAGQAASKSSKAVNSPILRQALLEAMKSKQTEQ